jgi:hypothetical protein
MEAAKRTDLVERLLAAGEKPGFDVCREAAFALGEPESPFLRSLKQQAAAWALVVAALDEVMPDWVTQGFGGDMAADAIQLLAQRSTLVEG